MNSEDGPRPFSSASLRSASVDLTTPARLSLDELPPSNEARRRKAQAVMGSGVVEKQSGARSDPPLPHNRAHAQLPPRRRRSRAHARTRRLAAGTPRAPAAEAKRIEDAFSYLEDPRRKDGASTHSPPPSCYTSLHAVAAL